MVESFRKPDFVCPFGVLSHEHRGRVGALATDVTLGMPFKRANVGQEPLYLDFVWDQLPMQIARIPINEHAAHIEDNRVNWRYLIRSHR
jgi:hypothetical protein